MKKSLVIITAALVAGSALAQTVTSQNVVGYNKVDRMDGLQIVGTSWEAGTIGEVLGYDFAAGSRASRATKLYTFDGTVYTQYYLYTDGAAVTEWRYVVGDASAESVVLNNSDALFISDRDVTAGDVIVMNGEVNDDQYTTNVVAAGLSLLTYPFSVDVDDLNDLTLTQLGDSDSRASRADKIIVFDTGTGQYVTYYLHEDTGAFEPRQWVEVTAGVPGATPGVTTPILNGDGFFYNARGTINWVEENPYFGNL